MMNLARNPKQAGNAIQRARKTLGLTQSQLAAKVGLRQGTISLMESGNPATKLETLLLVLGALDLQLQIAPRTKGRTTDIENIF